jgi:uncharacterized metal-binding protein
MSDMNPQNTSLAPVRPADNSGLAQALAKCTPMPKPVVYACSGCSDAGEFADRIARELTRSGVAEMSCLAGIGGRVKNLMNKAERAEEILVIDGCPLNCARNTLELAGFQDFRHLELHRLGFRKGSCPPTPERVRIATEAATQMIAAEQVICPSLNRPESPVN